MDVYVNERMDRRGFVVLGRVQGVGFRWWTRREATRLGLCGSVRNLPDGSVSVMAVGAAGVLDELRDALASGPPWSRVSHVRDTEYVGKADPTEFTIES